MQRALQLMQSLLYQGSMVTLLFGTGIWLTLKTRFFQLRGLPFILRNTVGTLLQKDVVPAGFDDPAAVHDKDLIRVLYR